MSLKNLKLSLSAGPKPIDPLKIFKKLTLRGSIENIWDPQAEALRKWHECRVLQDNVIQMNTRGGKTLVGLLAAQSLVNELKRRVLFVVANNQLVEQTLLRANDIGFNPSARYKGKWHDRKSFESAESFCVTNYASVFNGFSTFSDKDISGIIFDDAHVAETIIRDQFTLKIPRDWGSYEQVLKVLRRMSLPTEAQ